MIGTFCAVAAGLVFATSFVYPDKISAPKTYPDGLEAELGGKGALLVSLLVIDGGACANVGIGEEGW